MLYEIVGFTHPLIAVFYFALAIIQVVGVWYFRPFSKLENWTLMIGLGLFFVGCGVHHLDFMTHGLSGEVIDYGSFHHAIASFMQVIGASAAATTIIPYLLHAVREGPRPRIARYVRDRGSIRLQLLAYLLLAGAMAFGLAQLQNVIAEQRALSMEGRKAIVESGNTIAVDSCNRDYQSRLEIRRVITADLEQQKALLKAGEISPRRFEIFKQFYADRLRGLPLPDCRKAAQVLTSDPNTEPRVPIPLYPGR